MREKIYFELPELEQFFIDIGADISRTTITRYGQNGLMYIPKRKDKLQGLKDSRIYYNPVVAIEILVAYMMLNGEFGQIGGRTKMAKFTTEDVFFARIRHHEYVSDMHGFFSSGYYATIRTQMGKKMKTVEVPNSYGFCSEIFNDESYEAAKRYYDSMKELKEEPVGLLLRKRYIEYISLFSPPGIAGEELKRIQDDYLGLTYRLYDLLFTKLLKKYESMLINFDW